MYVNKKNILPTVFFGLFTLYGSNSLSSENESYKKADFKKVTKSEPVVVKPPKRFPIKLKRSPETLQGRHLRAPILKGMVRLGSKRKVLNSRNEKMDRININNSSAGIYFFKFK